MVLHDDKYDEYMLIDGDPVSPAAIDGKPRIPFIDISILNRIVHVAKEVNIDALHDGLVLTADGHVDRLASAVQQAQTPYQAFDSFFRKYYHSQACHTSSFKMINSIIIIIPSLRQK